MNKTNNNSQLKRLLNSLSKINYFTKLSKKKESRKTRINLLNTVIKSKTTHLAFGSILLANSLNLLNSQVASAISISLKPTDLGWYSSTGYHFSNNTSYTAGDCRGEMGGCLTPLNHNLYNLGDELRNFFVFNTSNITGNFTSAKLKLQIPTSEQYLGFLSPTNLEFYQLAEVTTPINQLTAGGGLNNPRPDIFQNLGTGIKYSDEIKITNDDLGTFIEIPLNNNALNVINSLIEQFAISGANTSLNHTVDDEFIFGFTHSGYGLISENPVELILESDSIAINATDSGWYSSTGYHFSDNTSYMTGDCRGTIGGCLDSVDYNLGNELRNFFVFDLPTFNEPVNSATLKLQIPYSEEYLGFVSPTNLEFYQLAEVTTPINQLTAGGSLNNPRPDIFQNLGTGIKYSDEIKVTNDDLGTFIEIPLNDNALNVINSLIEKFALSGASTSLNHNVDDEFIFGFTHPGYGLVTPNSVQLILKNIPPAITENEDSESKFTAISNQAINNQQNSNLETQSTPEPSALLGIIGLGIFGAISNKKKTKK